MALRKISVAHQSNAEETFVGNEVYYYASPYSYLKECKDIAMDSPVHTMVKQQQQQPQTWLKYKYQCNTQIVVMIIVVFLLMVLMFALYVNRSNL
jgi:hypothetical protein